MLPVNPYIHNSQFNGESFLLQGSTFGILLLHGFTSTTLEVRQLAEFLHTQSGATVAGPLLPGHGTSPDDLAGTSYTDWIDAAEKSYLDLRKTCKTIVVGGESMGGLLTLILAAKFPEIKGMVLFAPALITPGMQQARWLKWFVFSSNKKNLDEPKDGYLPWQGYKVNPLKAVDELGKLQSVTRKLLPEIQQPVLIFQGGRDETIDSRSSKVIYETLSSSNKQFVTVGNCGHCVLLDAQYPQIYIQVLVFIQSLASGSYDNSISENQ
jgi:carboxylesterase